MKSITFGTKIYNDNTGDTLTINGYSNGVYACTNEDGKELLYTTSEIRSMFHDSVFFVGLKLDYCTLPDVGIELYADRWNHILTVSDDATSVEYSLDRDGIIAGINAALTCLKTWKAEADEETDQYDDAIEELQNLLGDIIRCI